MVRKALVIVVLAGFAASAASAADVGMNLSQLAANGWNTVVTVDSSGRGGVYEKVGPYGGLPAGDGTFMFTEGNSGRATNPWSAITTANYNGMTLSQITALTMRTSGFEGADANNFQPPHFLLSFVNSGGNTRCAEWLPWTDGIPRTPGNSTDGKFNTYDAMTDGSWFVAWSGKYYNTWADMITGVGGTCTIVANPPGYGAAWRGNGFSVGYGVYDSSNAKYNSDGRGLVDWFTVGIDGSVTKFYLNDVPEPATMTLLVFGGLATLRRKRR